MSTPIDSLELQLVELGKRVDWPIGADLVPRVKARIETPTRGRLAPRWLAQVAAAVVVAVLLLTPPGQEAVAWLLRVAGIRVEFTEATTPVTSPATLVVGDEVTLAEAQEAVDFEVLIPDSLPAPDSAQLASWGGGRQVVMAWAASDALPEVFETSTGLLLVQFRAEVDRQLLTKQATEATKVEQVMVRGVTGYFLFDAPHVVMFENPDGAIHEDTVRLAANVLIWEENGVTYRIESSLGLGDTLAIAESLVPAS